MFLYFTFSDIYSALRGQKAVFFGFGRQYNLPHPYILVFKT